jgi:DNA polymerase-3 subunit gamma/tau
MDNFIVSARKYRPSTFDMVVGQDSITNTLKNAIRNRLLAQAYLFCGPRGVGKTTCARIFAKTINCFNLTPEGDPCNNCESCLSFNSLRSFNIHELDAASNNKVDDIRTLTDQVRIPPQIGKYSVYIIDEVHMLSSSAFNAFLKTLEEPPAHAIFILATTEKHKIIPTILSRCQIFDFNRIRVDDIVKRLSYVAAKESVTCEENALHVIAVKADGAMRDALSIFDQMVSFCGTNITYEAVIDNLNVLDYEFYFRTVDAALSGDVSKIFLNFNDVLEKGFDGHNFISGLASHLRDLLVSKDKTTVKLLEAAPTVKDRYLAQADKCSVHFLYRALDICNSCDLGYKNSKNQRLHVEIALLKLSAGTAVNETDDQKKKSDKTLNSPPVKTIEPETQSARTPQPTPTDYKPRPRPANTDAPKIVPETVSIRDLLNNKQVSEPDLTATDRNTAETSGKNEKKQFSPEAFQEVWKLFSEEMQADSPRASVMFKTARPELNNENSVLLHLTNADEKDYFSRNYSHKLVNTLISVFSNPPASVETVVDTTESVQKLYSDDDKLEHLQEKYPTLKDIRKAFNLDLE